MIQHSGDAKYTDKVKYKSLQLDYVQEHRGLACLDQITPYPFSFQCSALERIGYAPRSSSGIPERKSVREATRE